MNLAVLAMRLATLTHASLNVRVVAALSCRARRVAPARQPLEKTVLLILRGAAASPRWSRRLGDGAKEHTPPTGAQVVAAERQTASPVRRCAALPIFFSLPHHCGRASRPGWTWG